MTRRPLALILLALLTLAGCGVDGVISSGPATYVSSTGSVAMFVSWTDDGSGHVSGSVQTATANTAGTGDKVTGANASLTGTLHGGQVSLVVNEGLGVTATWTGSVSGTAMTLNIPNTDGTIAQVTFTRGTVSNYNAAVSAMRNQPAPGAPQPTGDRHVTRYAITYTLRSDGSAQVALDLAFDFGTDPGHGPTISLPVEQAVTGSSQVREYSISDITASSPTGAPAGINQDRSGGNLVLKIGDPSRGNITGTQKYHVQYTIGAVVNRFSDHAEFYWNVVSPDAGSVPITGVTVHVVAPKPADGAVCYSGPTGSTTACDSVKVNSDGTATFAQATLAPGTGLTIAAHYPAATFPR
ncbi:MAG: DUF2207 domain-containing protein [Cellulomonas sp.]